jgi:hypothetical protein
MVAILKEVRRNLKMIFTYISFMTRDGEHCFMYFLVIYTSSFENSLFISFADSFIGSSILDEYILVFSPLSDV